MKKQLCIAILILTLVFTTVACGTGPVESGTTSDTNAVSDECTDNTTEEDSNMDDITIPEESNVDEVTSKDESSTTPGGSNNNMGTSRPLITRPVVPNGSDGDDTTEADTTEIGLPDAYETANIVYDCDDGSVLYHYTGKTKKDFDTVCAYYTQKGFKIYNSHSMGENTL